MNSTKKLKLNYFSLNPFKQFELILELFKLVQAPYQMSPINCVLLVDDDGVTNFINHRLIKKLNICTRIESAINGVDALNFLKEFSLKNDNNGPELIFLDINMPVLNGFEFITYFEKLELKNKADIKLIMLTTSTHPKDIQRINNETNIHYINKPLTEEKLINLFKNQSQSAKNG